MSKALPAEIIDNIYGHLPLEKVIYLSNYQSRKMFNKNIIENCDYICEYIIKNGLLEVLIWLKDNNLITPSVVYMEAAAIYNNIRIVKWLYEELNNPIFDDILTWETLIFSETYQDIFKYLFLKKTDNGKVCLDYSIEIYEFIIRDKDYKLLRWMCEIVSQNNTLGLILFVGFIEQDIYTVKYIFETYSRHVCDLNQMYAMVIDYIFDNFTHDIINNECLIYILEYKKRNGEFFRRHILQTYIHTRYNPDVFRFLLNYSGICDINQIMSMCSGSSNNHNMPEILSITNEYLLRNKQYLKY